MIALPQVIVQLALESHVILSSPQLGLGAEFVASNSSSSVPADLVDKVRLGR